MHRIEYIFPMNKKSQRHLVDIKLGVYKLNKRDLVNIEKIILKRINPSDYYVAIGVFDSMKNKSNLVFSSARYISKKNKTYHRALIKCVSPNIEIKFKSYSTHIIIPRRYYKNKILKEIDNCQEEISLYLKGVQTKHLLNRISV